MIDEKPKASTDACVMAFAACEAFAERSMFDDDDDGQARCNVCMANVGEPGDLITNEIMANAEHGKWCPVSMAFKALEAQRVASGKQ